MNKTEMPSLFAATLVVGDFSQTPISLSPLAVNRRMRFETLLGNGKNYGFFYKTQESVL